MLEREMLIDVSRLVWRSWTGRISTGIDRVCLAYLENFADRSQAVIQYRGIRRVLTRKHSEELFGLLKGPDSEFRAGLLALAPRALAMGRTHLNCAGAFYINVGHTDIDLKCLTSWVTRCNLRPIYMIHDLIPLTHSEFCRPEAIERHRGRVQNAFASATGIIANSNTSAEELRAYASFEGLREPPIIAAWLAGGNFSAPSAIPLKSLPHFVCVSTIEGRKNHFMLLQVWRRLANALGPNTPRLIIVGQKGAEASHVHGMLDRCRAIQEHITILTHCEDEELGRWIGTARALLMPSFAEGFGLPLIEAMQLGTPVIASDLTCFREIGSGIPMLLDPIDARAWELAIHSFLENGPERSRQLRLLRDYAAPRWEDHFIAVESWLSALNDDDRSSTVRPSAEHEETLSGTQSIGRARLTAFEGLSN